MINSQCKNKIIESTNKIKEINNLDELNLINNIYFLENKFLRSLTNIKSKIEKQKISTETRLN